MAHKISTHSHTTDEYQQVADANLTFEFEHRRDLPSGTLRWFGPGQATGTWNMTRGRLEVLHDFLGYILERWPR